MSFSLTVYPSTPNHEGKSRAVFHPNVLPRVRARLGDWLLVVHATSETILMAWTGFPRVADVSSQAAGEYQRSGICLDAVARQELAAEVGDQVEVRCVLTPPPAKASEVTLVIDSDPERHERFMRPIVIAYIRHLIAGRCLKVGMTLKLGIYGKQREFQVHSVVGDVGRACRDPLGIVTRHSRVRLAANRDGKIAELVPVLDISHSPWLHRDQKMVIRAPQTVYSAQLGDALHWIGIRSTPGVPGSQLERLSSGLFIHGLSGVGKTTFVQNIARSAKRLLIWVEAAHLVEQVGDRLSQILHMALHLGAPSIVCIENIDEKSDQASREYNASYLLAMFMDAVENYNRSEEHDICVIITSRQDDIPSSLSGPGRLSDKIALPVPDENHRLQLIHEIGDCIASGEDRKWLAEHTAGYVASDLVGVLRQAAFNASLEAYGGRGTDDDDDLSPEASHAQFEKMRYSRPPAARPHLQLALRLLKPAAVAGLGHPISISPTHWSDIGGYEDVKQRLKEVIEWPFRYLEAFRRLHIDPPRGVLLYGPPGCSKTMMARAVATETRINFIAVNGPEIYSKYVGDSEKAMRAVFQRARAAEPSLIFFDEIDAIGSARGTQGDTGGVHDRVLAQLLTELDGVRERTQVIFLAATNRPDVLDPALLRPGRLDRLIYVGLPNREARESIWNVHLARVPHDADVQRLVSLSEGFTGAEIAHAVREASISALGRGTLLRNDLEKATSSIKPAAAHETHVKIFERIKNRRSSKG